VLLSLFLIAVGALGLAIAGDRLVEFAAALARRAHLTPAVIGLTVVAAGTSMPELSVSFVAALRGAPEIAVGNVVGSNIANIGLILGVCGLLGPVSVHLRLLQFEYPFMLLSSWILLLLCRDGSFDRLEGLFFVVSMVAFLAYSVWVARREVGADERRRIAEEVPEGTEKTAERPPAVLVGGILLTLVGLAVSGALVVRGAVGVAAAYGLSERVIGLTVVAVGTSLPELVASIAAALKKHHEMALANVVGSNIFNVLMILGVTGTIRPTPVAPALVFPDMAVMLFFSILLFPLVVWNRQLGRGGGMVLAGSYVAYIVMLALHAQ
jgi:cation:H+ antiporter